MFNTAYRVRFQKSFFQIFDQNQFAQKRIGAVFSKRNFKPEHPVQVRFGRGGAEVSLLAVFRHRPFADRFIDHQKFCVMKFQHLHRFDNIVPQFIHILGLACCNLQGKKAAPVLAEARHIRDVLKPALELVQSQILEITQLAHQNKHSQKKAAENKPFERLIAQNNDHNSQDAQRHRDAVNHVDNPLR
jgi:hypothetical protein